MGVDLARLYIECSYTQLILDQKSSLQFQGLVCVICSTRRHGGAELFDLYYKGKRKAVDIGEAIGQSPTKKGPLPPDTKRVWRSRLKLLLFFVLCVSWFENRGVPCCCLVHIVPSESGIGARSRRYDVVDEANAEKTKSSCAD